MSSISRKRARSTATSVSPTGSPLRIIARSVGPKHNGRLYARRAGGVGHAVTRRHEPGCQGVSWPHRTRRIPVCSCSRNSPGLPASSPQRCSSIRMMPTRWRMPMIAHCNMSLCRAQGALAGTLACDRGDVTGSLGPFLRCGSHPCRRSRCRHRFLPLSPSVPLACCHACSRAQAERIRLRFANHMRGSARWTPGTARRSPNAGSRRKPPRTPDLSLPAKGTLDPWGRATRPGCLNQRPAPPGPAAYRNCWPPRMPIERGRAHSRDPSMTSSR